VKNFDRKSEFHLKILVCFVVIIEKRINLGAKYKARVSCKSEIKIIYSFEIYATLTDFNKAISKKKIFISTSLGFWTFYV
jgi:hypothetical protein